MPVSFGWLDLGGDTRFVFRRVATPGSDDGRPASFAAHILVGPKAELPDEDAARLYSCPYWLDVDDPSAAMELPVIPRISDWVAASPAVPPPKGLDLVAFLAALLTSRSLGQPLTVTSRDPRGTLNSALIAALVQGSLAVVPTGLFSRFACSTYEGGHLAPSFDVVGLAAPMMTETVDFVLDHVEDEDSPERRAAADLLANGPESPNTAVAFQAARKSKDSEPDIGVFLAVRDVLTELSAGTRFELARLTPALSTVDGALLVFEYPSGRTAVGSGLAAGDADLVRTFAAVVNGIPAEELDAVGAEVARSLDATQRSPDVATIDRLRSLSPSLVAGCLDELTRLYEDPARRPSDLSTDMRLELLQALAVATRAPATLVAWLLTSPPDLAVRAVQTDLPATWRARLVLDHATHTEVVRRASLLGDPVLVRAITDGGADLECLQEIIRLTDAGKRSHIVGAMLSSEALEPEDRLVLLKVGLEGRSPVDQLTLCKLAAAEPMHRILFSDRALSEMTLDAVASVLVERAAHSSGALQLSLAEEDLLEAVAAPEADAWLRLGWLFRSDLSNQVDARRWREGVRAAVALTAIIAERSRREAGCDVIFAIAAPAAPSAEDLSELANQIALASGDDEWKEAQRCLRLAAGGQSPPTCVAYALIHTARLISGKIDFDEELGSRRDINEALLRSGAIGVWRLYRSNPRLLQFVAEAVDDLRRPAKKWWAASVKAADLPKQRRRDR